MIAKFDPGELPDYGGGIPNWHGFIRRVVLDGAHSYYAAELTRLQGVVDKLRKTCLKEAGYLVALVDEQTGPLRGDLENIRLTLWLAADAATGGDDGSTD